MRTNSCLRDVPGCRVLAVAKLTMGGRMKSTFRFQLEVDADSTVTPERLRAYIHEAVMAWGSQLHPNDPLCALNEDAVRVVEASTGQHDA